VTWQWGQTAGDGIALLFGRVRPPADAADPARVPGFLVALGPEGPLGFASDVTIEERDDPRSDRPLSIVVGARGPALDVQLELTVRDTTVTRLDRSFGGTTGSGEFLQMRGSYRVSGSVDGRAVEFEAEGAAETFRGS
jgi:hypothetical protein